MKILRITASGLPLFKEELDICFYAQQRVCEEDRNALYHLSGKYYLHPACAFIGINASGKTSILKVIGLALNVLKSEPINHIDVKSILGKTKKATIRTYFYDKHDNVCCLETIITSDKSRVGECIYRIQSERLWEEPIKKITSKKHLTDFSEMNLVDRREKYEAFLPDDVSIIIAHNKKSNDNVEVFSLLSYTNVNELPFMEDIPLEIISFLDPTIEKLYFEKIDEKTFIHLKFRNEDEIFLNNTKDLEKYLSSGTIKGIVTFLMVKEVLLYGGYLLVDEIENHFNKEIVMTLVRFFMDNKLNKNGGTLIFSTHYPELLDEYDRNDGIYIVRNNNGITAENLNDLLKRNDIKKSDAYQSGFLKGTTPVYESYLRLKKRLTAEVSAKGSVE